MDLFSRFQLSHLDAQGNATFATELRQRIARSFDVRFPELKARALIPVSNEINPGASAIEWRSYSSVGTVKLIAAYADDLPLSDITGEQNFAEVRTLGGACRYTLDEINAFIYRGEPLPQRKMNAVREGYEQELDRLAALGDTKSNLVGLLSIPNATRVTVPNGVGGTTPWSNKTAQEMIDDVVAAITAVRTLTKGIEAINTAVMPIAQLALLNTTRYAEVSDITVLEFLQKRFGAIAFEEWDRCVGAGLGGLDRMVLYRRDPDALQLHIPKELAPLPPQEINLDTKVPHHGRYAGVICYRPLSVSYVDGV